MPKTQFINPADVRKSKTLKLGSIPVNAYKKSMKDELAHFSKDDLVRIYRDMLIIRAPRRSPSERSITPE